MKTIKKLFKQRKKESEKSYHAFNKAVQFLNPSKLDKKKAQTFLDKSRASSSKEIKILDEILDKLKEGERL